MWNSIGCVVILLILFASASAQMPTLSNPVRPLDPWAEPPMVENPRSQMEPHLLERQNQDRQLALKRDTDKLLEMAQQLKQNVDRTNANVLSMDVIKRAQEIEKLAKSVREKMKGD